MAFVPFVESDQPTMAAFNEKFQQNYEAVLTDGLQVVTGRYSGTESGSSELSFSKTFHCGFKPKLFILCNEYLRIGYGTGGTTQGLILWVEGIVSVTGGDVTTATQRQLTFTQLNTGLTMVGASSKNYHFNKSGQNYAWCAIGRKEE